MVCTQINKALPNKLFFLSVIYFRDLFHLGFFSRQLEGKTIIATGNVSIKGRRTILFNYDEASDFRGPLGMRLSVDDFFIHLRRSSRFSGRQGRGVGDDFFYIYDESCRCFGLRKGWWRRPTIFYSFMTKLLIFGSSGVRGVVDDFFFVYVESCRIWGSVKGEGVDRRFSIHVLRSCRFWGR